MFYAEVESIFPNSDKYVLTQRTKNSASLSDYNIVVMLMIIILIIKIYTYKDKFRFFSWYL